MTQNLLLVSSAARRFLSRLFPTHSPATRTADTPPARRRDCQRHRQRQRDAQHQCPLPFCRLVDRRALPGLLCSLTYFLSPPLPASYYGLLITSTTFTTSQPPPPSTATIRTDINTFPAPALLMNSFTPLSSPSPSSVSSSTSHSQHGDPQLTRALEDSRQPAPPATSAPAPAPAPAPGPPNTASSTATTASLLSAASSIVPQKPPKAKMTNRLSRMFSQTRSSAPSASVSPSRQSLDPSPRQNGDSTIASTMMMPPSSSPATGPTDRKSDQKAAEKKPDGKPADRRAEKGKDAVQPIKRFELLPDGTHKHTLKSARRQEKLSDMLRDMIGAGKKKEDAAAAHAHPTRSGR